MTNATRKTADRRIYYVAEAGYRHGFSGADHLLPDHHSGMVGRTFGSPAAAREELSRRTTMPVPATAVLIAARIPADVVQAAWGSRGGPVPTPEVLPDGEIRLVRPARDFRAKDDAVVVYMGWIREFEISREILRS